MALLVEALMMRTVRRLWNLKTGAPAPNSDVVEALEVCERSIRLADEAGIAQHPAIVHLHIHLLEMSTMPERGMRSADLLGEMCPDAGHMNHMPGHIYVLCGDYEKAKLASEKAVRANDLYLAYADEPTYYLLGCCHDLHLMMFTCMFLGQYQPALWAADKVRSLVDARRGQPPGPAQAHPDGGRLSCDEIACAGALRPLAGDHRRTGGRRARPLCADGGHAALRQGRRACDAEAIRGGRARARAVPPACGRAFRPSGVSSATRPAPRSAVGAALLDGELAYHQGRHDEAYAHLRQAVELDDNLSYTEPWAWMHPPRHALAALLLDQGHAQEAEQVYRDDLGLSGKVQRCAQHPDNVWALHGLVECLRRRGESEELPALQAKLAVAVAKADVAISSSCLCRTSVQSGPSCCH